MENCPDFKEWLELLNEKKVKYVIVGAHALAFYGHPRSTGDLDILIEAGEENAHKIIDVMDKFGVASLGWTVKDLLEKDSVIQIGVAPVRIDIINSLTGVSWTEIDSGKVKGFYENIQVFYIGRKEFIKNKLALGRKKDWADLEALGEG